LADTDASEYASVMRLHGKTALITGAAKRLGAAMSRELHAAGANIVVHYHRSADEATALTVEFNASRPNSAAAVGLDLLRVNELDSLVRFAIERFGGLDLLVNNASSFYATPFGEITAAHWQDLLGSNLQAPLFLSQAAAPALRLARGMIVNIVDIHGMRPLRRYLPYSVAKAGLAMLTKGLARELGPLVRVNGIAPGPVLWPSDSAADNALRDKIVDRTVLKRMGTPQDIARTLLYLACDAPYVTGQIIAVDGGRSIGW
jgi:pteridine reductase